MTARRRRKVLYGMLVALGVLLAWARWGPMDPLFNAPYSTVLLDRNGELLGAMVAADGQWRMPPPDALPERYVQCVIAFEDRHFRHHPGIWPPSLWRAWRANRKAGRIVRGGSTITMQVARLADPGPRTYGRKIAEVLRALRLELRCDKDSILRAYATHAPFGGNVVGLEAAAWRWFGTPPDRLGWAGHATLAVLPNAPGFLHPGGDRAALKAKRDRLLTHLWRQGAMDSLTWSLAVEEPLPDAPMPIPQRAPHLLATLHSRGHAGQRIHSTIDGALQDQATAMTARHGRVWQANEVHNAAALIVDVATGEVRAYVGNRSQATQAPAVDIVHALRSTGSLLKPFLYAAMLHAGVSTPDRLMADIPTRFAGFAPRNYDQRFEGAVHAGAALARSLNVPAVRALQEYGIDRALRGLRAMGLHHLRRPADHYGLSLVLGGAESTLWELTGAYASLVRVLEAPGDPMGPRAVVHPPQVLPGGATPTEAPYSAAAVHHTLEALRSPARPDMQAGWEHFTSSRHIAWKTGTSYGHRDAWAIGMDSRHVVGVWVGNASGEGRPGLTGTMAAGPLLFELFTTLPPAPAFSVPYDGLRPMAICRPSGHRAGPHCTSVDTLPVITQAERTPVCPYHRPVLVNSDHTRRVRPGPDAVAVSWFVLPPAMAHYHGLAHGTHPPLPPWADGAGEDDPESLIGPITPLPHTRIHVPKLLDGTWGQVVLEAAHRTAGARIDWDLDGRWLGRTTGPHHLPVDLPEGPHRLTLTDDRGHAVSIPFQVVRAR